MADVVNLPITEQIQSMHEQIAAVSARLESGGGGDHTGGMEARIAKLEAHVEHIRADINAMKEDVKSDFRWTWQGLAAAFVLTWAGIISSALLILNKLP